MAAGQDRPTLAGAEATDRIRELCLSLPKVTERLIHGEATWFIDEKKTFVSMSDHHHDERVSVTFAASVGVQESLVQEDGDRYFRPPYVGGRGWVGARLDGLSTHDSPEWERLEGLIVDAWLLVAPFRFHGLLECTE